MKLLLNSFLQLKQQAIGILRLSVPLLLMCWFYPDIFFTFYGKLFCALFIGTAVLVLQFLQSKQYVNNLLYAPTGSSKDEFERIMQECGIAPETVQLRYGYTMNQIATATLFTITMDPLVWKLPVDDSNAIQVKHILEQLVVPTLVPEQQRRLLALQELLSVPVQRFIFRHELGHVRDYYSYKKMSASFIVAALATLIGISIGVMAFAYIGSGAAIMISMIAGGAADLLLSYASNACVMAAEEKNADLFAVRTSSGDEVEAAAAFFERYQHIMDERELSSYFDMLPSVLASGHMNGMQRAAYIRTVHVQRSR